MLPERGGEVKEVLVKSHSWITTGNFMKLKVLYYWSRF